MIEVGRLSVSGVRLHSTGQQLFDVGYALLAFFGGHADSFRVMTTGSETLFVRDIGILYFPRAGGGARLLRRVALLAINSPLPTLLVPASASYQHHVGELRIIRERNRATAFGC